VEEVLTLTQEQLADLPDESESVGMYRGTFDAVVRALTTLATREKLAVDILRQIGRDPMIERDRYAAEVLHRIGILAP
jgi:hypothetical protein